MYVALSYNIQQDTDSLKFDIYFWVWELEMWYFQHELNFVTLETKERTAMNYGHVVVEFEKT